MKSHKEPRRIGKHELQEDEPFLNPPTQNMEENLANGVDEVMPDPDDVPGGFTSNETPRPDLLGADAQAIERKKSK